MFSVQKNIIDVTRLSIPFSALQSVITDEPTTTDEPSTTDEPVATDEPTTTDKPTTIDEPTTTRGQWIMFSLPL